MHADPVRKRAKSEPKASGEIGNRQSRRLAQQVQSWGASSCLREAGTYQEGVLCRSSARSVLGPLRRFLLISHVYSMFSPCLAHDTHSNLPTHLLTLKCEMAPSCPVNTWAAAAGTVWGGWGSFTHRVQIVDTAENPGHG